MTTKPASGIGDPLDDGIEESDDESMEEALLDGAAAGRENPVNSKEDSHAASDDALRADAAVVADDDLVEIPIPDVVSADSPDDVPRGRLASDGAGDAEPIKEEDVVVSEDEVRVKVEAVPHEEAVEQKADEGSAGEPPPVGDSAEAAAAEAGAAAIADGAGATLASETAQQETSTAGAPDELGAQAEVEADAADLVKEEEPEIPTPVIHNAGDVKTPVAAHQSVTDASTEDETKIEPYATAMRAAAMGGEEREAGLATQAKEERDRALRQAGMPIPRTPTVTPSPPPKQSELDDDADDELRLDDDTETETPSELRQQALEREASTGRGTPPTGYPGRRLPTPNPGVLQGPAYANIPVVPRLTPSKSFSGIKPPTSTSSAIFSQVRLPLGGLVAVLGAAFSSGLLIGAVLWRATPADVASHAQPSLPAIATPEPAAPPAPPSAAAPTPTAVAPAPTEPTPAPTAGEPTPTPSPPVLVPPPPVVVQAAPEKPPVRPAARPAVAKPKKTASAKSKTTWVDPFAQ